MSVIVAAAFPCLLARLIIKLGRWQGAQPAGSIIEPFSVGPAAAVCMYLYGC